jgi:hypothetical protein
VECDRIDAGAASGVEQGASDGDSSRDIGELPFTLGKGLIDFMRQLGHRVSHAIAGSRFGSSAENDIGRDEKHGQRGRDAGGHDNRQLPRKRQRVTALVARVDLGGGRHGSGSY